MIKKLLIISALLVGIMIPATAQERNQIFRLHVDPLTYVEPSNNNSVGAIMGTLAQAASGQTTNNRHPEVVPYINAVVKATFSDVRRLSTVEDAAQYTLQGDIIEISTWTKSRTKESKDSKGRVTKTVITDYYASTAVSLTLTDNETGESWTHKFTGGGNTYYYFTSEAAAIESALNSMQGKIVDYYNNLFPLTAQIVDKGKENKDKINEVYIDLGSEAGVHKGLHFNVSVMGETAGRATEHKIGKIKIQEVQGPEISLCKVEKGKKEIKQALDEGVPLIIKSIY